MACGRYAGAMTSPRFVTPRLDDATMRVTVTRQGPVCFEARDDGGATTIIDGPVPMGGEGRGLRPMELLLSAFASCSAMDVVKILDQQKQDLRDLRIVVEGLRHKRVPTSYRAIHLRFEATGVVEDRRLQRAVRLSVEKYCPVAKSLSPDIAVTWEARLQAGEAR
jgi:putative redox protein